MSALLYEAVQRDGVTHPVRHLEPHEIDAHPDSHVIWATLRAYEAGRVECGGRWRRCLQ